MRRLPVILFALCAVAATAKPVTVDGVRAWPAPDHTRVVFDVSDTVVHRIFQLDNPSRLVIDLNNALLAQRARPEFGRDAHVRGIRFGRRNGSDLRVVLDLAGAVRPKSFMLAPSGTHRHRLVVDVYPRDGGGPRAVKTSQPAAVAAPARPVIIAIDAGHGGEDPGATGPRGTREKDVTMAVARRLAAEIDGMPGFKAVLVRDGDYYLRLRSRINRARKAGADLLVSVHADAFKDSRVRGSSVWVLSPKGATSEAARWLAARENAADLVGGVSLDDKDDLLAQVLLDLSQTATLNDSVEVASATLKELSRVGRVHRPHVERAGFVVLKAPDIPSILVETAFISNPLEERNLRNVAHQNKLAGALARGIGNYFRRRPPPGTVLAARRHIISDGETLSQIASRYRVSVSHLMASNKLNNDRVRTGQVLTIPPPS